MTTTTPIAGNYTDNAAVAQRLKHAAIDSLHSFRPGTGPLTVAPISDEFEVTAQFIQQIGDTAPSCGHATSRPHPRLHRGQRHRPGRRQRCLLTHQAVPHRSPAVDPIATPVNQEPIIAGPNAYIAAAGEHVYQLHQQYDARYRPVWLLTTPGLDLLEERRFAGIPSAVAYITDTLTPAQAA